MKKIILIACVLLTINVFAQKNNSIVSSSFSGQFVITTDTKSYYCNFGGPTFNIALSKQIKLSVGMFPSLRFKSEISKPIVTPTLGAGIQLTFKKIVFSLPCYYQASNANWYLSGGVGLKL